MVGAADGPLLVTGASGFIGSWLVMKLLQAGYTVRATVRDPTNVGKTQFLRDLPGARERLTIWRADMSEKGSYDEPIKGCVGVFHLATPMDFFSKDPENEIIKPAIEGMLSILKACKDSGTVRRVIFTSSAGTVNIEEVQKRIYDETMWSDMEFCRRVKMTGWMYFVSKTLAEKAALEYAAENSIDFISVIPTLVVGPFITNSMPPSLETALALITGAEEQYFILKQVQLVHLDDLCASLIFLYENPKSNGRYISSSDDATIYDLAKMIKSMYPEYNIPQRFDGIGPDLERIHFSSKKLTDMGFKFQYSMEEMFRSAIDTCREKHLLPLVTHVGDSTARGIGEATA